ncbi:MAG: hypothetical protein IT455_21920 [Planctomycetes bacterium]|nr:hypothetical protein [Planctomycetota bacterium]
MDTFDRRSLFAAAVTTAGLGAAPAWLARWFQPQDPAAPAAPSREQQLRAAVARAHEEGRPLLVFVVPEQDPVTGGGVGEASTRGHWFGALLNHCGAPAVFDIAACVPACASTKEVAAMLPTIPIEGEPLLLIVDASHFGEAANEPAKVTRVEHELGSLAPTPHEEYEQRLQRMQKGVAAIAESLKRGLDRHGANLASLAAAAKAKLEDADRSSLERWLDGGDPVADRLMVRMVAEVRRAAGARPDAERRRLLAQLEAAVDHEVVKQPIAGARWFRPGGCGSEPEQPTAEEKQTGGMIACGMAMMPPLCERFLSLYVQK